MSSKLTAAWLLIGWTLSNIGVFLVGRSSGALNAIEELRTSRKAIEYRESAADARDRRLDDRSQLVDMKDAMASLMMRIAFGEDVAIRVFSHEQPAVESDDPPATPIPTLPPDVDVEMWGPFEIPAEPDSAEPGDTQI